MYSDLRFAFRTFRRSPGLIAAAILATALGVGANTAIFSVMQAVLLRPLPYRDPGRLVVLWEKNPAFQGILAERLPVAPRNYLEWKRQSRSFSGMAEYQGLPVELTGSDQPEQVPGARVTPDFFPLLGRTALHGRLFRADEGVAGREQVALLSYSLFQRRFGGDPKIVGRSIRFNRKSYEVAGVLPADFHLPALYQGMEVDRVDVFVPMSGDVRGDEESERRNYVFARLADGVSVEQARAEMAVIAKRLESQYKFDEGFGASVFPISVEDVGPSMGRTVVALQVAVGFLLLIACANVANLLLARAAGRGREMAIRAALGASARRLVRQALAEGVLLSALGGGLGILVAVAAMAGIRHLAPEDSYHLREVGLNWVVLAFGAVVAAVSGILFGMAPALGANAANLQETLAQDGRAGTGRRARRLRGALVVSEVALALMMLAGAGLMARSLSNVLQVDPGFRAANVLTFHVKLAEDRYPKDEQIRAFCTQLLDRLSKLGGVESAAISSGLPLMDNLSVQTYRIEGEPPRKQEQETDVKLVSEDYFRTVATPILRGRGFTRQEAMAAEPPVVVLTESLAARIFPRGEALGRTLLLGRNYKRRTTVVGIVPDTHELGLDTPLRPEMFLPSHNIQGMAVEVRTKGEPMALAKAVTAEVWAVDKDQPVSDLKPLEDHLYGVSGQRRFDTLLFGSFAGLALLLAAVGLYGVLSYTVMLRRREIGVRMALGARGGDVVRLVLRNGMVLALAGTAVGGLGALMLTQLMRSLVFGVSASDPVTFGVVAGLLLVVAVVASYIPARRASRMDPVQALRMD